MKKIKKIIFSIFVFFILGYCYIQTKDLMVKADGVSPIVSSNIKMQGASIRTTGVQGLRFVGKMDLDKIQVELSITKNNITAYGIVVSYGETDSNNLFLGQTINNKSVLYGESNQLLNADTNEFSVVLYNFSSDYYLQNFTARAYIKYNDGSDKIAYSKDVITRSIYKISLLAEEDNPNDYTAAIIDSVETKLQDVITIEEAKVAFDADSSTVCKIKGVITALSSGDKLNATIEDNSGALILYSFNSIYSNIIKVGNEVILTTTLQKFNGLYETGTISSAVMIDGGKSVGKYVMDAASVFETGGISNQGKIAYGFLKYVSTDSNRIYFTTSTSQSAQLYINDDWSTYAVTDLIVDEYYYVNGLISYYNSAIQLTPYDTDLAILSINSITAYDFANSYYLDTFNYTDIVLEVTLSNDMKIYVNVKETMLSETDLESLQTMGEKDIDISCFGANINLQFSLIEKEITSISADLVINEYLLNETLDLSDSTINILYADGTTANMDINNTIISGFDSTAPGEKELTISYCGKSTTVDYIVKREIVIYDIYPAGGNSGALYLNDYIVLYNNTDKDINLNGYKLLYSSNEKTFNSYALDAHTIYANSFFFIKAKSYANNGTAIDYENISFSTFNMAAGSARIALVNGDVPTSVTSTDLIDNVLYSGTLVTKSYQRTSLYNDTFTTVTCDLSYLDNNNDLIDINVSGMKVKYYLNDSIDLSSAIFTGVYKNGKITNLEVSVDDIVGFDTTRMGTYAMQFTVDNIIVIIDYTVNTNSGLLDVQITFIDLGDNMADCGESTYIKVGDDIDILIDCGEASAISGQAVNNVLNSYVTDNTLEYVIATHAHSDHIGGMPYVLPNYDITNIIEFDYKYGSTSSDTDVIGKYLKAREKATNIDTAYDLITTNGDGDTYTITLASDITLTLYDSGYLNYTGSDKNCQSIICVFEAYETRVLFNGDAESSAEKNYASLVGDVDIFKLGHHGTYAATSTYLLNCIKPEVAIVCNGNYLGNKYAHPTYDAMSRVYDYSANTKLYAITGSNINSVETTTSTKAGTTALTLYAYFSGSRYNFYFKCTQPSQAMNDRNGNIYINIFQSSYSVTSEFYGSTPREMRSTTYWQSMDSYINQ